MSENNTISEQFEQILKRTTEAFNERSTVLSFEEYLQAVFTNPKEHLRSSSQYLLDAITFYGKRDVLHTTGKHQRYNIFDEEISEGSGVIGHVQVQEQMISLIKKFARSGKSDRLILLHGPNGSAKSSLVKAMSNALELYSHEESGIAYRFNWIFPRRGASKSTLGFQRSKVMENKSYAYLSSDEILSTIPCELRDHPLFLLSTSERERLFTVNCADFTKKNGRNIPDILFNGQLSQKNKQIFDSLLREYQGDLQQVLRHVQVERFYFSRRYKQGVVNVEPQMRIDAFAQQMSADRNFSQLPPSLHHLSLFQSAGALSNANRGVIEFSDLLKRPLETWKYLLIAIEQGEASLDHLTLFLDMTFFATTNEIHLNAFQEHPDWPSFKGRFELVTVPYLLRYQDELAVYQQQIPKDLGDVHIAPHALEIAARWAVLTRLEAPAAEKYTSEEYLLLKEFTAEEKLEFYDTAFIPERFSQQQGRQLLQIAERISKEYREDVEYEGRYGVSVREIRMLLLNAAQHHEYDHLSPFAVLESLRALVKKKSLYAFLNRKPVNGYRDATAFIGSVEKDFSEKLEMEIRGTLALVELGAYVNMFTRYLMNVSAWVKKSQLEDPVSGKMVNASESLMKEVEDILLAESEKPEDYRHALIREIASQKLEHPNQKIDYSKLFATEMQNLEDAYYQKHDVEIQKRITDFLHFLEGEQCFDDETLGILAKVEQRMYQNGYNKSSAKQAVVYYLKHVA